MDDCPQTRLCHELFTPLHQVLGIAQLACSELADSAGYQEVLKAAGDELTLKLEAIIENCSDIDLATLDYVLKEKGVQRFVRGNRETPLDPD